MHMSKEDEEPRTNIHAQRHSLQIHRSKQIHHQRLSGNIELFVLLKITYLLVHRAFTWLQVGRLDLG